MERTGIHELSAAYALNALDSAERREFEDHLSHCEECRYAVISFQETAAALAYEPVLPPPPPELRERILEEARRERPKVVPLQRRWALPAAASLAAAAACAALGLGIWAATLQGRLHDRPEAVGLSGATGALIVSPSHEGTLVIRDIARAPAGKTYEIWVIEDGSPRPAGTFSAGGRVAVVLTRAVPDDAIVAVTLERAGGVDRPTTRPFISSEPV
jgi:anti-sigma-K factor RskA